MKAAWYDKQGRAADVLVVGEMPDPLPGAGEVRIRIAASGINPGDTKKREDAFGIGMAYPRVIPHSDGAGTIDMVGGNVSADWMGKRVWCFGAQSYRPFGTAAEYTVVPVEKIALLPDGVTFEQGACLGIPGITAYQAVHVAGPVNGRIVLVQGAGGAVGQCAVALAKHAGAHVIGTIRSAEDEETARRAGADDVLLSDGELLERARKIAPDGVDHVIEVAFAANVERDVEMLKPAGSISAYATNQASSTIPFWPMVFKNLRLYFLGSDDFPPDVKTAGAAAINDALVAGWPGFEIGERVPLVEIARAHELTEHPQRRGRVVLML